MEDIVGLFESYSGYKGKKDDDWFDRLNNKYTVIVILVLAGTITFYQLGLADKPIVCWCPAHFADSWEKYTNSYCWVKNTYYLPFDEEIPPPGEKRDTILYYQWVPFILLVQALCYFLPSIVWHGMNSKGGIDADSILVSADSLIHTNSEEARNVILSNLTKQMDRFLTTRVQSGGSGVKYTLKKCLLSCWHMCGRRFGSYLISLFLLTKVLYIANAVGQFFMLNLFLFKRFNMYGFEVLGNIAADHNWHDSPMDAFPRVTMCDFHIRRLGVVQRYTVQCALPLNLWNEKAYMFLWFWMVFVAGATVFGFLQWVLRFLCPGDSHKFIANHVHTYTKVDRLASNEELAEFTKEYLKSDGVFLLRLISHNTNNITTSEITCALWDKWIDKPKKKAMKALDAYAPDSEEE